MRCALKRVSRTCQSCVPHTLRANRPPAPHTPADSACLSACLTVHPSTQHNTAYKGRPSVPHLAKQVGPWSSPPPKQDYKVSPGGLTSQQHTVNRLGLAPASRAVLSRKKRDAKKRDSRQQQQQTHSTPHTPTHRREPQILQSPDSLVCRNTPHPEPNIHTHTGSPSKDNVTRRHTKDSASLCQSQVRAPSSLARYRAKGTGRPRLDAAAISPQGVG